MNLKFNYMYTSNIRAHIMGTMQQYFFLAQWDNIDINKCHIFCADIFTQEQKIITQYFYCFQKKHTHIMESFSVLYTLLLIDVLLSFIITLIFFRTFHSEWTSSSFNATMLNFGNKSYKNACDWKLCQYQITVHAILLNRKR